MTFSFEVGGMAFGCRRGVFLYSVSVQAVLVGDMGRASTWESQRDLRCILSLGLEKLTVHLHFVLCMECNFERN
jgi:hypothetical protein